MLRSVFALLLATVALPFAHSARAQSQEDIQNMVVGFYLISVAVDVCDLDITKEQEKRLEGWIEWGEGKLKVADRKLDKAYAEMEAAAKKDKTAFCAEMKPIAAKSVKELPALP
jgi:hypothetical protein